MKIKFGRNKTIIEVTNDSIKVIVLDPKRAIAILHIRLLRYFAICEMNFTTKVNILPLNLYKIYLKDTMLLEISFKKKQVSQETLIQG